jgi:LysR family hydrogen peroxide-inducible transcriptional activator
VWLLNQGHCFRSQVLNLCNGHEQSCSRRGFAYESGSIETLKRMVDRHYGYTLVPELSVLDEIGTNPVVKAFCGPRTGAGSEPGRSTGAFQRGFDPGA